MDRVRLISLSVSGLLSLVVVLLTGIFQPACQGWMLASVMLALWWLLFRQWYGFLRHDT